MTGCAEPWKARTFSLGHSHRLRVAGTVIVTAFTVFNLAGFSGVPWLVGYIARGSVAARLHRRVTVGTIRFNPYTLRLSAETLHVSQREGSEDFAAVGQLRLKASWTSLFRLAPIIQEITISAPALHIVRNRSQVFNFADLIAPTPSGAPSPASPSSRRLRFAVSNIRVYGGQVFYEDEFLNEHHRVDQIQIGVPFIANLPADTGIFVQPLLQMVIDGSPFRVMGVALPFAPTPESTLEFRIKTVDLTRVAAYVAHILPIKIPRGALSSKLQVHFIQPKTGPVIKIGGSINVEGLDVRDASNAPLVNFKTARVALTDVEPLHQIAILGDISIDNLSARLVLNHGGTTNLTPLTASSVPSKDASTINAQSKNGGGTPFYLFVRSFALANSELDFHDNTTTTPVALAFKSVHVGFQDFDTNKGAAPVPFQVQARLGDGSLGLTGNLDRPHSHAAVQAALDKIDLPPLQAFVQPFWAGTLTSGKLSAKAQVVTDFAPGKFNILVQPAGLSLDTIELHAPGDIQKPVRLKSLNVKLPSSTAWGRAL